MPVFEGVGVALVTLFDAEGGLDAPATASLATRVVDAGVRAVVVAGTTGEAATLTPDERIKLLEAVRAAVPAEVPVLAGTGAPSRRQAVALTHDALGHGADAVLALSPPGSSDLPGYYRAVADAADGAAVLAYHYPDVSAPGIPVDVLPQLPVDGVKDSSGEAGRLLHELDVWDRAVYTGSSALLSYAGPLGCAGAILSLANVEAQRCIDAFAGDAAAQRALGPIHRAGHEAFPRRLKELVAERFGTSPVTRLG